MARLLTFPPMEFSKPCSQTRSMSSMYRGPSPAKARSFARVCWYSSLVLPSFVEIHLSAICHSVFRRSYSGTSSMTGAVSSFRR